MAAAQLTASSISARSFPSFGGVRPSNAKLGSPAAVSLVGQRSFPGLVVKAATAVAPKGEVAAVWEGNTTGKTKETIADILTAIRNADMREKRTVRIPSTNMSENIVKILLLEGFIENVRKHQETNKFFLVITLKYRKNNKGPNKTSLNLKQISKPGLRIYAKYHKIPRVLGGMGIVIVSTSRGVMTDREARIEKVGGEILCYVW